MFACLDFIFKSAKMAPFSQNITPIKVQSISSFRATGASLQCVPPASAMCFIGKSIGIVPSDVLCAHTQTPPTSPSTRGLNTGVFQWQCIPIAGLHTVAIVAACREDADTSTCSAQIDVAELDHDVFVVCFAFLISALFVCCCCTCIAGTLLYRRYATGRRKLG